MGFLARAVARCIALFFQTPGNDVAFWFPESDAGFCDHREHEVIRSVVIQIAYAIVTDVTGKFPRFPFKSKSDSIPEEGFEMSAAIVSVTL